MIRRIVGFLVVNAVASAAFAVELVSPAQDEEVCLSIPQRRAFLVQDAATRRALFLDRKWRKSAVDAGYKPAATWLVWKSASPTAKVEVVKLHDGKKVFCKDVVGGAAMVENLEIAREYSWRVTSGGESAEGRFRTMDLAPRDISLAGVPNIRDLGGRMGMGGRRVRQGLVYRSAGLNDNALRYYKPKEVLAFYEKGELEKKFGADGLKAKQTIEARKKAGKLKKDDRALYKMLVKEWCKGKERLTDESREYAIKVLGIKTDIDLRRTETECWGMDGSPLGPTVKWINIPSSSYGGMATDSGKEAFAKVFRVFLDKSNYPLDFHCIGGADRTGAVGFIINALLGVSQDELDKDWEITCFTFEDQDFGHKTRYDKLLAVFNAYPGANIQEKVENYVKSIGFTDEDIAKLREIMLEGPECK